MTRVRTRPSRLSRNARSGDLHETFLVSAVATILLVRSQLWLLDYPQIGGGGLHIAHLLWGGLLMLVAIGLLLTYLGRRPRMPAAVVGGAGFGLFIDELGKFVTADNNYFFRPAAALIYLIFLGLFFGARALAQRRPLSSSEYIANALDLAAEAVSHDLDEREKQRALEMLSHADPTDPVVSPLHRLLGELDALPVRRPRAYERWAHAVGRGYLSLIQRPRFAAFVDWIFVAWAMIGLAPLLLFVASLVGAVVSSEAARALLGGPSPIEVLGFASSAVSATLVAWAVRRLETGARLAAYRAFDRALMVSILLTDTSLFYLAQFSAAYHLGVDLVLLVTIRYMIRRERALERAAAQEETPPGAAAAPVTRPPAEPAATGRP